MQQCILDASIKISIQSKVEIVYKELQGHHLCHSELTTCLLLQYEVTCGLKGKGVASCTGHIYCPHQHSLAICFHPNWEIAQKEDTMF